jgi:hypothetical protein
MSFKLCLVNLVLIQHLRFEHSFQHDAVKNIESMQEAHSVFTSKGISIVVSFDPYNDFQKLPIARKLLRNLSQSILLRNHQTQYYTLDILRFPEAVRYVTSPSFNLVLSIHRRVRVWNNFRFLMRLSSNLLYFHELIKEVAEVFLEDHLEMIPNLLQSFEQVESILKRNDIFALYLGKNDTDFNRFEHLALSRMDCTYYYSFDNDLASRIFLAYANRNYRNTNVFVFLRSSRVLNQFDSLQLEYEQYHPYYNIKDFENFYLIEKFPKFRSGLYIDSIIENGHSGFPILLYLKEGEGTPKYMSEFSKSVQLMEKRMVFCHLPIDSPQFEDFVMLFKIENVEFKPEKVYMVYSRRSRGFVVIEHTGDIEAPFLISFVQNVTKIRNEEMDKDLEENGVPMTIPIMQEVATHDEVQALEDVSSFETIFTSFVVAIALMSI